MAGGRFFFVTSSNRSNCIFLHPASVDPSILDRTTRSKHLISLLFFFPSRHTALLLFLVLVKKKKKTLFAIVKNKSPIDRTRFTALLHVRRDVSVVAQLRIENRKINSDAYAESRREMSLTAHDESVWFHSRNGSQRAAMLLDRYHHSSRILAAALVQRRRVIYCSRIADRASVKPKFATAARDEALVPSFFRIRADRVRTNRLLLHANAATRETKTSEPPRRNLTQDSCYSRRTPLVTGSGEENTTFGTRNSTLARTRSVVEPTRAHAQTHTERERERGGEHTERV